jgi:hypothetical protein
MQIEIAGNAIEAMQSFELDSSGEILLHSKSDFFMTAENTINIAAAKSITLTQSGAHIKLTSDGLLEIVANKITHDFQSYNFNAGSFSFNSPDNLSIPAIKIPTVPVLKRPFDALIYVIENLCPYDSRENSPPEEGWTPKADGVVEVNHKNQNLKQFEYPLINLGDKLPDSFTSSILSEIYSIKNQCIAFPSNIIALNENQLTPVHAGDALCKAPIKGGDYVLSLSHLYELIPVNLDPNAKDFRTQLIDNEITYFKNRGGNAVIFIHGFHVGVGQPAMQIENITLKPSFNNEGNAINTLDIQYLTMPQTIARTKEMIEKQFPVLQSFSQNGIVFPESLTPATGLNGTGAHEWMIAMEDNLNRATNQFDGTDYSKYQRCIHVLWPGDVSLPHYLGSEPKADVAGLELAKLLRQLIKEEIDVSIIAHSMGNRVALRALNELGKESSYQNKISNFFSWDAAVPDTAFTQDPSKIPPNDPQCFFPNAADAVAKITVLYTNNDKVLKYAYYGINTGDAYMQEILEGVALDPFDDKAKSQIKERVKQNTKTALGCFGPDLGDNFTKALFEKKKLSRANLTNHTHGYDMDKSHSYMQYPSKDIMKYAYKKYIVAKNRGLNSFGLYEKNQFSDISLESDDG